MALQESFELYDATGTATYGSDWYAQTFTTESAYSITDIALKCWKYGSPGNITVSIRAVDTETEKPTGIDKCSVTVAEGVISSVSPTWYTFTFDTSYILSNATKYAIVWRAPDGSAANYFAPFGYSSSGYVDGDFVSSSDSGSSWSFGGTAYNRDMNFRAYGEVVAPIKAKTPAPIDTFTGMTLDYQAFSWVSGTDTPPDEEVYNIYWGTTSDDLSEIVHQGSSTSMAAAYLIAAIGAGLYNETYYWRVDTYWPSTDKTADGDEWWFSSIDFSPPLPTGLTLTGGDGDEGDITGTPSGLNFMTAIRKLVVAANSKIWYEDI